MEEKQWNWDESQIQMCDSDCWLVSAWAYWWDVFGPKFDKDFLHHTCFVFEEENAKNVESVSNGG